MLTDVTSAAIGQPWYQEPLPGYWVNNLDKAERSLRALLGKDRTAEDFGKIDRALECVKQSHREQKRKGTDTPYAVHPIRLACLAIEAFGVSDVDLLCAALLHDILEDTATPRGTIERAFGARCASLVSTLSRLPGEERPAEGDHADASYLRRIREAGDDAITLKMADKIDNLRDAPNHPDRDRVKVYVEETFSAYVPLARSISDPRKARCAERLLLQSAARTGGTGNPSLLKALLSCLTHALVAGGEHGVLTDIPFPRIATDLYLFLNPDAQAWLEFDGVALTYETVESPTLARRIASSLRRKLTSHDLPLLLDLAGIPPAFASPSAEDLWRRAAGELESIQTHLSSDQSLPWLDVLLRPGSQAALLALIQSCIYLPASWRCPLWSVDLGAVFSERIRELSGSAASTLPSFALAHRLALSRYAWGSGTLARAQKVFDAHPPFDPEVLWALRIGAEYLQETGTDEGFARPEILDKFWSAIHDGKFKTRSFPKPSESLGALAPEPDTTVGAPAQSVETIGLHQTRIVFEEPVAVAAAGHGAKQFAQLRSALSRHPLAAITTRWIEFDHEEWRKRRPRWSQPGQLRIHAGAAVAAMEPLGARVICRRFGNTELMTVLPARKFALQDRLPEMSADDLNCIERGRFTSVSIFDRMILDAPAGAPLWTPRVYRILDTINDLDPEGAQTFTVEYDGSDSIPSLHAYLPLPDSDLEGTRQPERKRFLARYIAAQVYSCALVRRVNRARISCSAVAESRRKYAFTDDELLDALSAAERESGLRSAFGTYIERYSFDPFGITSARPQPPAFQFGREEMRQGSYVGVDVGGQFIKIAVARNGALLDNPARPQVRTPDGVTVSEFCRQVLANVSRELDDTGVEWREICGIGISWPGAVRDNRIAGMSRVLEGLTEDGRAFSPNDPINRLGAFDFLSHFATELRAIGAALKDDLALSLLNDGDAEAFGNHTLRTLNGLGKEGGKIFVKLGTSLAGGRVTAAGAVADDVAEFSKIALNLKSPRFQGQPGWLARHYISAEGVRNLSRSFHLDGEPLFGERNGLNSDASLWTRIEPVELGRLLPLFTDAPTADFLDALIASDNHPPSARIGKAIASTAAALKTTKRQALVDYISERRADLERKPPGWTTGLQRTLWLCTGSGEASREPDLPADFPYEVVARTIVGSVSIFSQLGLHVAHLIAQLYNIYRRGAFSEVVLAGGVLGGQTGEIVERQAKGFLGKYYDKIYGERKPLGPDTLVRASFEGVSNPGVFGAAMSANRQRLVERDRLLGRKIEERLRHLPIGEEVPLEEILALADDPAARPSVLRLLDQHFASGAIARTQNGRIQKIS